MTLQVRCSALDRSEGKTDLSTVLAPFRTWRQTNHIAERFEFL